MQIVLNGKWRSSLPKLLRIMKLVIILLTVTALHVAAKGYAQKVSLSLKNAPLEKVFREIRKQTGIGFFFTRQMLENAHPVSIEVKDVPVEDVLKICFNNQPLSFQVVDNNIVVQQKEAIANFPPPEADAPPPHDIHGQVLTKDGEPLAGANVTIKRTGKSTITNAKGEFTLQNIVPADEIVVSFIGYAKQTILVKGRMEFVVYLEIATNDLDKVVVQAYGTTTQRLSTGDIATVTAAEIEKQPVMNPLLALQGKVAGLDVVQTSGYANAPIKVELRGRSAIGSQFVSDPLYIIDGVPLTIVDAGNSTYNSGSTGFLQTGVQFNGPANGQSPFFSINPSDIESIEVLKDAAETSIYGSRGANGVILITTKKGRSGKTKLDLHVQEGITKQMRFWELLNTQQYLEMRREAFKNDNLAPTIARGAYDLLSWDTTRYTDWQKELYGGTGKMSDVQASLSGGDVRTNFRLGIGYTRTTSITTLSGADQRGSASLNLIHKSLSQRFSVSLSSQYTIAVSDMIQLPQNIALPPNAPAIYDSAGNLNYKGWGGQNTAARFSYPFYTLKQPYSSKTNFMNANLSLNYELAKGLNLSTSFGYNDAQANQESFQPIASKDPLSNPAPTGSSQYGYNTNKNWIVEPQLTYATFLGKGRATILIGSSLQQNNTEGIYVSGTGYTSDDLIRTISNAQDITGSDISGEYRYAAVFGRVNYNWENKYLLNVSARRDGSSRFGANRQYGNFGSIGAVWIFSEESWLKKQLSFISFGKLRASYGTTGSDAVGDYQYLTRWSSNGTLPYSSSPSLVAIQHANPDFQWQVNKKLEGGIELGLAKDRVRLTVNYYLNRCGNQLISFPTPAFSGFTSVTANSPALVENKGWEFIVNASVIETKNFKWLINFNGGFNHNKLVDYPNFSQSPFVGTLVIGQPLNISRALHYTGVDPQTGQYTFYDKNHDGQITYDFSGVTSDDSYVYVLAPKFLGGLGMNFIYKGVQLDMFFNIKKQIGVNAIRQGAYPGVLGNQPVGVMERWRNPGDIAPVARFTTRSQQSDQQFKNTSDGGYTDASFIRLSNLSLSYNLPSAFTRKAGIQGCSVFVHMNNLFVITGYKGIDPETQRFGSLPPSKTIVGGLSFAF